MNKRICRNALLLALMVLGVGVLQTAVAKDKKNQKPFLAKAVSPKQSVRFYKANKQLQADRISLTGGESKGEGCHNLIKKARVFKMLQIGFPVCQLYTKKNCDVGTLVSAESERQLHGTYFLTEGVAWFPQGDDEQGVKIASWSCGSELDEGVMRFEVKQSRREVGRLNREKREAEEALAKAQAEFSEAEKASEKSLSYAEKVKAEAIKMGVIDPEPEDEEGDESDEDKDDEVEESDQE